MSQRGEPNLLLKKFLEWTKSKSNALGASTNFGHLKQGYFSLAKYIDKATTLCDHFEYPPEAYDRLLRDVIKWLDSPLQMEVGTGSLGPKGTDSSEAFVLCHQKQVPLIGNKGSQRGTSVMEVGPLIQEVSAPQWKLSASSVGKTGITVLYADQRKKEARVNELQM